MSRARWSKFLAQLTGCTLLQLAGPAHADTVEIPLPIGTWEMIGGTEAETLDEMTTLPLDTYGTRWQVWGYRNDQYVDPGPGGSVGQYEGFWIKTLDPGALCVDDGETE